MAKERVTIGRVSKEVKMYFPVVDMKQTKKLWESPVGLFHLTTLLGCSLRNYIYPNQTVRSLSSNLNNLSSSCEQLRNTLLKEHRRFKRSEEKSLLYRSWPCVTKDLGMSSQWEAPVKYAFDHCFWLWKASIITSNFSNISLFESAHSSRLFILTISRPAIWNSCLCFSNYSASIPNFTQAMSVFLIIFANNANHEIKSTYTTFSRIHFFLPKLSFPSPSMLPSSLSSPSSSELR